MTPALAESSYGHAEICCDPAEACCERAPACFDHVEARLDPGEQPHTGRCLGCAEVGSELAESRFDPEAAWLGHLEHVVQSWRQPEEPLCCWGLLQAALPLTWEALSLEVQARPADSLAVLVQWPGDHLAPETHLGVQYQTCRDDSVPQGEPEGE